jgi:hypothetical protein
MEQRFNAKLEALEQRMDAKLETMFLRIAALLPLGVAPNIDMVEKTPPPKSLEVSIVLKEQDSEPGDAEAPLAAVSNPLSSESSTVPEEQDSNPGEVEVQLTSVRSPVPERNVFEAPLSFDAQYFQQTAAMDKRQFSRDYSVVAKRLTKFLSGNSKNIQNNVAESDTENSEDHSRIKPLSGVSDNRRLSIRPPPEPPPINRGRY